MRAAADVLYIVAGFMASAAIAQESPPAPVLRQIIRQELERQFSQQNKYFALAFWAAVVLATGAYVLNAMRKRHRPGDDRERLQGLRAELETERQSARQFRTAVKAASQQSPGEEP